MEKTGILVIGSTNTDMVTEVPRLPMPGETVIGHNYRTTPGGKGANQAVAASRAGGSVTFITAIGDDILGQESLHRFKEDRINTEYAVIKKGVPSGVASILVDPQGENVIAVASGANSHLNSTDLEKAEDAFQTAKVTLLQLEIPMQSVIQSAKNAHEKGSLVILNPAPMPEGGLSEELLSNIDILTPNEGELMAMAKGCQSFEEAAQMILSKGPQILVVTCGRKGSDVFTHKIRFKVPAFSVKAIDTVGAGDCFSACLAVAFSEGKSLEDAVRFATAGAALSTTRLGAQDAMPRREEIEKLLEIPSR